MKPTTVLPSKLIYHPETGVDLWCRKSYICNCSFSKMKKWKKIIPKPAIITAYGVYWLIRVCCLAGLALFSFKKQNRSLSLMVLNCFDCRSSSNKGCGGGPTRTDRGVRRLPNQPDSRKSGLRACRRRIWRLAVQQQGQRLLNDTQKVQPLARRVLGLEVSMQS